MMGLREALFPILVVLVFSGVHAEVSHDLGRHTADFIVQSLSSPVSCEVSDIPHGGLRYIITKQKLSRLAPLRFTAQFMEIT